MLPLYGTGAKIRLKNTFNKFAEGTLIKEDSASLPFAVAKRGGCSYVKALKREGGYSLCSQFISDDIKIICSASSIDCVEICYQGNLEKSHDFLQIKGGVTVFYFTPSEKSYEITNGMQKAKISLFTSVFTGGAYVVVLNENEEEALRIIYER